MKSTYNLKSDYSDFLLFKKAIFNITPNKSQIRIGQA